VNYNIINILVSIILLGCVKSSHTNPVESDSIYGKISMGKLNLLYSNSVMPYTMDASWATLRNSDSSITFFETAMGTLPYYYRYSGTASDPLNKVLLPFKWDYNGFNNHWPSGCWISNIYKISTDTLLGFVHREDLYPENQNTVPRDRYFIGIARSFDGGSNWKYLGDIMGITGNLLTTTGGSNIAGVPYLVVGDFLYIYYDERDQFNSTTALSVGRAKLADVINAMRTDHVTTFVKFNNGNWTENAFTGVGTNIIPNFLPGLSDFHSDAAYCSALGMYLITVQTGSNSILYLYQSTDGVNWKNPIQLDYAPGCMQPYSSFVGFNSEASDDSHIVGSVFYIYIDRKKLSDYNYDDMYSRKITIQ